MTADLKAARAEMTALVDRIGSPAITSNFNTLLTALDQAAEALEPFSDIGDFLASKTEGFADDDKLNLVTDDEAGNVAIADVSFGDFRQAATVYATLKPVDTKEGEG
jgi:hypothetical protein